jgi:hypothetical protein
VARTGLDTPNFAARTGFNCINIFQTVFGRRSRMLNHSIKWAVSGLLVIQQQSLDNWVPGRLVFGEKSGARNQNAILAKVKRGVGLCSAHVL